MQEGGWLGTLRRCSAHPPSTNRIATHPTRHDLAFIRLAAVVFVAIWVVILEISTPVPPKIHAKCREREAILWQYPKNQGPLSAFRTSAVVFASHRSPATRSSALHEHVCSSMPMPVAHHDSSLCWVTLTLWVNSDLRPRPGARVWVLCPRVPRAGRPPDARAGAPAWVAAVESPVPAHCTQGRRPCASASTRLATAIRWRLRPQCRNYRMGVGADPRTSAAGTRPRTPSR